MSIERSWQRNPRVQQAVAELRALIQQSFPAARFEVGPDPEDPEIIRLTTVVDVGDTGTVMEVMMGRMLALQIEDGLLIYMPVRPAERVAALRRAAKQAHA